MINKQNKLIYLLLTLSFFLSIHFLPIKESNQNQFSNLTLPTFASARKILAIYPKFIREKKLELLRTRLIRASESPYNKARKGFNETQNRIDVNKKVRRLQTETMKYFKKLLNDAQQRGLTFKEKIVYEHNISLYQKHQLQF